jgi:hypothetical protein
MVLDTSGGPHGCWTWAGKGNARSVAATVAYQLVRGPVAAGTVLRKTCDGATCINPHHREATSRSMFARTLRIGRRWSHCKQGHELTPDNVYSHWVSDPNRRLARRCATCKREQEQRYKLRRRLLARA